MKKNKMIVLALALGFILSFSGISLGDGGGIEPPIDSTCECESLPKANNSNPLIQGYFTSAYDKSQASIKKKRYRHYNIQIVLEMTQLINGQEKIIRHLFSYQRAYSEPICSYDADDLIKKYKCLPCILKVGEAFDLEGVPVLTKLEIIKKDCCDNDIVKDDMIYGTLVIRVVPKK